MRGISLLLFFSLLFGCGVRNDYPVEKDEFKVMVHYINSHYQPNDAVVVSNMFNYLSYVYYNKKGYRAPAVYPGQAQRHFGQAQCLWLRHLFPRSGGADLCR